MSVVTQYRSFVETGLGKELENPLKKVYAGTMLGSEGFVIKVLQRLERSRVENAEISHRQALSLAPSAEEVLGAVCEHFGVTSEAVGGDRRSLARKVGVYLMKKHTGATNRQIGELIGGMSCSAVAKTCQRLSKLIAEDEVLRSEIEGLEKNLSKVKGRPL